MIHTDTNSNATTNSDMNLVRRAAGEMPIVSWPVVPRYSVDSVVPDTCYKYKYTYKYKYKHKYKCILVRRATGKMPIVSCPVVPR